MLQVRAFRVSLRCTLDPKSTGTPVVYSYAGSPGYSSCCCFNHRGADALIVTIFDKFPHLGDNRFPLHNVDLADRADRCLICMISLHVAGWEQYDLHDLLIGQLPGLDLYSIYPSQHTITAGEELDDLFCRS